MRNIQNAQLDGKKVLVRADFNVAISDGKVQEEFKLCACKQTVDHVLSQHGTKIALISHLGRPEGQVNEEFSLKQILPALEKILGRKVIFVNDCIGQQVQEAVDSLGDGDVALLENVRFHGGDESNDLEFSEGLSKGFDVFINDAFSVCHRDQASVTGVTRFLPSYAGLWLQKEIEALKKVAYATDHPAVAIIGGAKIETKLPLIKKFEESYDWVLVGGRIANEAIEKSVAFSSKVLLPVDFAKEHMDIGKQTIEKFKEKIAAAKLIVWNGPMGKFEQSPFDQGTREILGAVVQSGAFTVVGGGESVQAIEQAGLLENVSFVSTGGGAMLEYLSGNSMPGIDCLRTLG